MMHPALPRDLKYLLDAHAPNAILADWFCDVGMEAFGDWVRDPVARSIMDERIRTLRPYRSETSDHRREWNDFVVAQRGGVGL